MALTFTNRASQFVSTNATSYVSSTSFTPTAGNLMVLVGFWSSTDTAEVQPTSVSGNGVTYSQHATTFFQSAVASGGVWAGIVPASPTLGSVTVSGFSTNRTGISFQIWEISGADVSGGTGLSAIADVVKNTPATATSGSITMTDHSSGAGNLCVGFFDHSANEVISAGAGNTLDATGSYATPTRGAGGVHNTSSFANVAASWTTSVGWRGIGVEIAAAGSGGTAYTDSGTASISMSSSGADSAGSIDAGTASVSLSSSGTGSVGSTDAGTGTITVTASGIDSAGSVDAGTASLTVTASGTDSYNAGGTEYIDAGTATITLTTSGSDSAGYTDAGTATATIATSGINYVGYTDAGTGTVTLTTSGTGNVTTVDAGTATFTVTATGTSDAHFIDSGSASISITATGTSSFNRPGATVITAPFGINPRGNVGAGAIGKVSNNPTLSVS